MAFRVSLEPGELPEVLEPGKFEDVIQEEMTRAVNERLVEMKNAFVKASPFGGTNTLRTGWQIKPAVARPGFIQGSVTNATVQANVIEDGAVPHSPPVGAVPALGTWIRRALSRKITPFVFKTIGGKKVKRPADLDNPKDVESIAIKIGQAIQARGLPSKEGKSKGFFTRIFRGLAPRITALMEATAERITKRLSGE